MLFLFLHILGDYYFQSSALADKKANHFSGVFRHCAIYGAVCIAGTLPIFSTALLIAGLLLAAIHFLVDYAKLYYINLLKADHKYSVDKQRKLYFADQIIHLFFLFLAAYSLSLTSVDMAILPFLKEIFTNISLPVTNTFAWILMFLLICKPANITIRYFLCLYRPKAEDTGENDNGRAGSFIGSLERLLILILLSINQFSAIGLVLTAKSIARYDKISKDKAFAEYYLLGTLLSTVIVITVYILIS